MCVIVFAMAFSVAGCGNESTSDRAGEAAASAPIYEPVATEDCLEDAMGKSVANVGRSSQPSGDQAKVIAERDYLWPVSQYTVDEPIEVLALRPTSRAARKYKIVQNGAPAGDSADAVYGEATAQTSEPVRQTVPAYLYYFPSAARAAEVKATYDKVTRANPNLPDLGVNREECADCYAPVGRRALVQGNVLITYANGRVPQAYQRLVNSCLKQSKA